MWYGTNWTNLSPSNIYFDHWMSDDPAKYVNVRSLYWTIVMVGLSNCVMLKFNKLNLIASIY